MTSVLESTKGYIQKRTFPMSIASSAPGATVSVTQTFDFARYLWCGEIQASPDQTGDLISLSVNPNQAIGALGVACVLGATVITVDVAAGAKVWPGEYLIFNDATLEKVQIKSFSGLSVTLCNPVANAHAILTPLGLTITLMDRLYLNGTTNIQLWNKGFRGLFLDINSSALLEYTNNTGRPKVMYLTLEYYTGPQS